MGIRESADLFGSQAPDIPDHCWLDYLKALAEFAYEGHEPVEPDWD